MIRVLFFARLREELGVSSLDIPAGEVKTLEELKHYLYNEHPDWADYLIDTKILSAVNQVYVKENIDLVDGDEVAFFPPVTGG